MRLEAIAFSLYLGFVALREARSSWKSGRRITAIIVGSGSFVLGAVGVYALFAPQLQILMAILFALLAVLMAKGCMEGVVAVRSPEGRRNPSSMRAAVVVSVACFACISMLMAVMAISIVTGHVHVSS